MPDDQLTVIQDRFWAKVDQRGPDECWPWLGGNSGGYGRVTIAGRSRPATQVAWEIANGEPFPAGKRACHSCDNPPCVNPAHLWAGTQSDNLKDCVAKGRHTSKPHEFCQQGHPLTPDNRRPAANGNRCIICNRKSVREAARRFRARQREMRHAG